jgi:hypothetical protein
MPYKSNLAAALSEITESINEMVKLKEETNTGKD